jgi:hypothetical protein
MAIAFRRPFTLETQELRDATDMSGKVTEEIACQACKTIYVFLYPNTATSEQIRLYRSAVQQAMGACGSSPRSPQLVPVDRVNTR